MLAALGNTEEERRRSCRYGDCEEGLGWGGRVGWILVLRITRGQVVVVGLGVSGLWSEAVRMARMALRLAMRTISKAWRDAISAMWRAWRVSMGIVVRTEWLTMARLSRASKEAAPCAAWEGRQSSESAREHVFTGRS